MTVAEPILERFQLSGRVGPLLVDGQHEMAKAMDGWLPSRPMGGWLMTYGRIGPDGGVIPTVDRDEQIVEAARELGHIDWTGYLKKGRWNDTHRPVYVGLPRSLEFHDGTTALSKAHGKVGFWTTGWLFDRRDPMSWDGLGRTPTPHELDRSDHFWRMAQLLKGTPRVLGFSADGSMTLSPCRRRILKCWVNESAVCEVPVNPDATAEPMLLGQDSPLRFLRKGMVGSTDPDPCRRCRCPEGSCAVLRKAVHTGNSATRSVVPEDLEADAKNSGEDSAWDVLINRIMERYKVSRERATEMVRNFQQRGSSDG